jgi:hypothetical protein
MKRINFTLFFACFVLSLLPAQQTKILESKPGEAPEWLDVFLMDGYAALSNMELFKDKYIFFTSLSDEEDLNTARYMANRNIVSDIGGQIRRHVISSYNFDTDEENVFLFNDEMSAYEVFDDSRSKKIEEDYWMRIRRPSGAVVYVYYKIVALEKSVVDEKIKQFQ